MLFNVISVNHHGPKLEQAKRLAPKPQAALCVNWRTARRNGNRNAQNAARNKAYDNNTYAQNDVEHPFDKTIRIAIALLGRANIV